MQLNLVDLNLQEVQKLLKNQILVKSDARYTSQQIEDMVGISKAFAIALSANNFENEDGKHLVGPSSF